MSYALTTTIRRPFADTLTATRAALAAQGFGILTGIDLQATLKANHDGDAPAQAPLAAPAALRRMLLGDHDGGELLEHAGDAFAIQRLDGVH